MSAPRLLLDSEAPSWVTEQVEVSGGCWYWTGSKLRRYGGQGGDRAVQHRPGQPTRNAARALWLELRGPIDAGLVVRHTCDRPLCMRPEHLRLGTAGENTADARERRRLRPGGTRLPDVDGALHPQA